MILADTSIWIDHLRTGDASLAAQLTQGKVLSHPFIIGELALGNLRQRAAFLQLLHGLPCATPASDSETLHFIHAQALHGRGIGYVDAHLLASARLSNAKLWTRDKRLQNAAVTLGLAHI
jgi:hypothetical protein